MKNAVLLAQQMRKGNEVRQFIHKLTRLMLHETAADAKKAMGRKLDTTKKF